MVPVLVLVDRNEYFYIVLNAKTGYIQGSPGINAFFVRKIFFSIFYSGR